MKNIFININTGTIEKTNIKSELYGITIGCRNISDFKNGVYFWSCGDGCDFAMTQDEINYFNNNI